MRSPWLEFALTLRRRPGQPVKVFDRDLAPPGPAFDLDDGIEGDERDAEVRRMCRNAGVAPAKHGVQTVLAVTRVAAGPRFAPVACACDVIKIAAPRPLHEISGDRRGVAQLRRCTRQKRFGNRWKGPGENPDHARGRRCARAHRRARAVGEAFDSIEARKPREVDEAVGPRGAAFHQVQKVGAAREIGGTRFRRQLQSLRKSSPAGNIRMSSCRMPPVCFGESFLRVEHGLGDAAIGAASAEIAAHALAHAFRVVTGLPLLDQADRAHDLAWRAEPALQTVMGNEGGLHRMKAAAVGYAFDRKHIGAVVAESESQARIDAPAIDQDGARAALAAVAALLRAGEVKTLA